MESEGAHPTQTQVRMTFVVTFDTMLVICFTVKQGLLSPPCRVERSFGQTVRLKISTWRLCYLKFKDPRSLGLKDGESEEEKNQKPTGQNWKNILELQEFLENALLLRQNCLCLTTDNRNFYTFKYEKILLESIPK